MNAPKLALQNVVFEEKKIEPVSCILKRIAHSDPEFQKHVEVLQQYRNDVVMSSSYRIYVERYYQSLPKWNSALEQCSDSSSTIAKITTFMKEVSFHASQNNLEKAIESYVKFEDLMNSI